MKRIIICESKADAELLSAVLPEKIVSTSRFFASEGKSVGVSRARSLLSMYSLPLLLVEDADTLDTATTLERIDFVRQSLSLASRGAKFDVAVIVPELEVMFFQTIDVARKIFGKKVDERFIVQGQLQPKATMLAERISTSQLMRKRKGTLREILGVTPLVKSIVDQIAVIDD